MNRFFTLGNDGNPMEFACDCERGYIGYLVIREWVGDDIGFPAFTHEQMENLAAKQERLISEFDHNGIPEQYGRYTFDPTRRVWVESYHDGVWSEYEPFEVDGLTLYAAGDGWAWGDICNGYEYENH